MVSDEIRAPAHGGKAIIRICQPDGSSIDIPVRSWTREMEDDDGLFVRWNLEFADGRGFGEFTVPVSVNGEPGFVIDPDELPE